MRDIFIESLLRSAKKNPRIMLVTGDLGFGVLSNFANELPMQFINAGIAEQLMTGLATGMALEGRTVFTYSIGNFPTLRALEQIRNDAAYHDAEVKIISVGAGFSYGALGMSHHATEDLAIMRAIPQLTLFSPGCLWEVEHMVDALIKTPGTCYLRLDKSNAGRTNLPNEIFSIGKLRRLRQGSDGVIFATGGILSVALSVSDQLKMQGFFLRVYSVHSINPFDSDELLTAIAECRICFSLEEHRVEGGLGSLISEICMEAGIYPAHFYRFGLRGRFTTLVGSQDYLREKNQIDFHHVSQVIYEALRKNAT